jgi:hypothetical protein
MQYHVALTKTFGGELLNLLVGRPLLVLDNSIAVKENTGGVLPLGDPERAFSASALPQHTKRLQ